MKKAIALSLTGLLAVGALTGCVGTSERSKAQAASQSSGESLEIKNLKKKKEREEDPNVIQYVYIYSFGTPIGYYIAKGKVSSSGSQIGPELELANNSYRDSSVLDSAKDDGSYGTGDPGIFFFTPEDIKIETSLDYILSDAPIPVDVPRLSK